ncbi:zinc finger BED domain-containing protein RICESLEEPER 2-like [Canna indica]|uniref:Zinc finger BED domain-containing protein RICESLEEPER 2-like n=1 Tax=Canna indica TaxID=4628 RepID=A0AAQ3Q2B1_9LILI|nr:zinc finger BED domain-containing protein RICESLEEPER 2-like [Canna indica]
MRCIAHIINLIVQDGLKDLDPAIRWVREAVKYIRSSPARLKKFKECADSVQVECMSTLCLDVCTRWNSTYLMLSVAEKYEKAFERFKLEDLYFGVEVDANSKGFVDWDVVRRTITMLGLFYDTTIRVSGSLYVTSNTFWTEISDLLSAILEWTRSDDSNVKGMGTKMKIKFDKYWGNVDRMNKIIFFAVVLDPREKLGTELFERVKMSLYDIFKEYKNMLQIESGHSSETSPSSNTSSNESVAEMTENGWLLASADDDDLPADEFAGMLLVDDPDWDEIYKVDEDWSSEYDESELLADQQFLTLYEDNDPPPKWDTSEEDTTASPQIRPSLILFRGEEGTNEPIFDNSNEPIFDNFDADDEDFEDFEDKYSNALPCTVDHSVALL